MKLKSKAMGKRWKGVRQQKHTHNCQHKGIIAPIAGDDFGVIISVIKKIVLIYFFYVSGNLL